MRPGLQHRANPGRQALANTTCGYAEMPGQSRSQRNSALALLATVPSPPLLCFPSCEHAAYQLDTAVRLVSESPVVAASFPPPPPLDDALPAALLTLPPRSRGPRVDVQVPIVPSCSTSHDESAGGAVDQRLCIWRRAGLSGRFRRCWRAWRRVGDGDHSSMQQAVAASAAACCPCLGDACPWRRSAAGAWSVVRLRCRGSRGGRHPAVEPWPGVHIQSRGSGRSGGAAGRPRFPPSAWDRQQTRAGAGVQSQQRKPHCNRPAGQRIGWRSC